VPLPVPQPLAPTSTDATTDYYTITEQVTNQNVIPGKTTPMWTYNGTWPGPLIRATSGRQVKIHVVNNLSVPTTLHNHGAHVLPSSDGSPVDTIPAGGSRDYVYPNNQSARTQWFHDHVKDVTGKQVYMGLEGLYEIADNQEKALNLPTGAYDVPLVFQDRKFNSDGTLNYTLSSSDIRDGLLGDTLFVNGVAQPYFKVEPRKYRLRLLNGSNARVYRLGFTDGRTFHQVATDAGLLARPRALDRLLLAPGERAEIVVEFESGEETVLRSFEPALDLGFPTERFMGGDDTFDIIALRAARQLRPSPPLPTRLDGAPAPVEAPAGARRRHFEFTGLQINHQTMEMTRVDEVVPAGATEIWEIERGDEWVHVFHVHGAVFHLLDINGEQPPAYTRGPKDTVYLHEFGTHRLAVRFDTLTDPMTPYMYHCHVLRHEDQGMMGQFTVVRPGTEASAPRTLYGNGGGDGGNGDATHHH
jgi:FtsP/CotA-like multicopper oxidase with cupredoxin domain